jgi:hypothetical protein
MSLILQYFWGEVLGCAAEREGPILDGFSEAKISQFEVSISSDEYILGFEVAVDDVPGVEVLEDGDDMRRIKAESRSKYADLWGSNMPSSLRCENNSPPGTYSKNM